MTTTKREEFLKTALAILFPGILLTACVVRSPLSTTWKVECAWCKTDITQDYYVDHNLRTGVYRIWRGDKQTGEFMADVDSHDKARELIAHDKEMPGVYKSGEFEFCSLRCLNAFLASQNVKEDRLRIIPNE